MNERALMQEKTFLSVAEILASEGRYIGGFQGKSMRPMLRDDRDSVLILPITRPYRKYDVLLYRSPKPGRLVMHRVVKVKPDGGIVIRGDNCYFNEYHVTPDRVVGILGGYYKGRDPKMRSLDAPSYRLYAWWRVLNYPLRRIFYYPVYTLLRRIYHTVFRRKK